MAEEFLQSTTRRVPLKAYLASDHVSDATGKTIAITISKNGAAFGNPNAGATNATSIGNGWYYVDLDTTDTATLGPLLVRGTEGTIDNIELSAQVVKATNRGATALPDTACTTNASLVTSGTGTSQISVSSGQVIIQSGTGTGQIKLSGGYVAPNWGDVGGASASLTLTNTTIGRAVNLTNAPTSGDFTATMKTSIGTAVAASAVASVTDKTGFKLASDGLDSISTITLTSLVVTDIIVANSTSFGDLSAQSLSVIGATSLTGVVTASNVGNSIRGIVLSSSALDAIEIESGVTLPQAIAMIGAEAVGRLTGAPLGPLTFYAMDNPMVERIYAVVSADGRTSVTLTLP